MTKEELIEAIKAAACEREVLERSRDYYSRDPEPVTIFYVDPHRLIDALENTGP